MSLLTLGLNHRSAPVAIRERVAFAGNQLVDALDALRQTGEVSESAIVSTCNRTEIVAVSADDNPGPISDWLCDYRHVGADELAPHLYSHRQQDSVIHTLRVAAGLDSMVIGEPQILGQMKQAFQAANDARATGPVLSRLFQHAFSVAKQVRTQTGIGTHPVSIAFAAVHQAQRIFADLEKCTALLIGAGETIELLARHLHDKGLRRLVVANRSLERAQSLASRYGGYAISLDDLALHLPEADLLMTSTSSEQPLLMADTVKESLSGRRHRPLLIVDLGVPRDVDPAVRTLADVYHYGIDDLQDVIDRNLQTRRAEAEQAEQIIQRGAEKFMHWLDTQDTRRVISSLRDHAEIHSTEVLEEAKRRLERGDSPESVIEWSNRALTRRLMHEPSRTLRHVPAHEQDELLRSVRRLFKLDRNKQDN